MRTGLVHAYFGEGKGKSTAALGLGLRCAGSGMTVFVIQFLKSSQSGELEAVLTAIAQRIVELNEVLDLIEKKPTDIEIVVTGKTLPDAIYRRSNYVTEMRLWKHPRQDGIEAREGIEY